MTRLQVCDRFQQSTLTHGSLPGFSLDQFASGASYRIAGGTGRTFFGQAKNVLKIFKQRPVRVVRARPTPVVRRRLHSPGAPRVMGTAPQTVANQLSHALAELRTLLTSP